AAPADLVRLAEQMAANADGSNAESIRSALQELQRALGVPAGEAARSLAGAPVHEQPAPAPADDPFDPARLHAWLDGDNSATRARVFGILTRDEFRYIDTRDTAAYRAKVLEWCRILAGEGIGALAFPQEFGGRSDVAASVAAFET